MESDYHLIREPKKSYDTVVPADLADWCGEPDRSMDVPCRIDVILKRVSQSLVSHHYSRHVCTCAGTLQSSSGRSCIALAGNKWTLAGELLLSLRAEGYGGGLRPCLYVKGVQKFLSGFELQIHFLDSTPTPVLIQLY